MVCFAGLVTVGPVALIVLYLDLYSCCILFVYLMLFDCVVMFVIGLFMLCDWLCRFGCCLLVSVLVVVLVAIDFGGFVL